MCKLCPSKQRYRNVSMGIAAVSIQRRGIVPLATGLYRLKLNDRTANVSNVRKRPDRKKTTSCTSDKIRSRSSGNAFDRRGGARFGTGCTGGWQRSRIRIRRRTSPAAPRRVKRRNSAERWKRSSARVPPLSTKATFVVVCSSNPARVSGSAARSRVQRQTPIQTFGEQQLAGDDETSSVCLRSRSLGRHGRQHPQLHALPAKIPRIHSLHNSRRIDAAAIELAAKSFYLADKFAYQSVGGSLKGRSLVGECSGNGSITHSLPIADSPWRGRRCLPARFVRWNV